MRTHELPAVVLERYSTRQSVCFCGVFPEIRRAWATVDNALFLWRFDVPDDVPVEYSGEEQAIVSVGLAKPKPGVFLPSVERVLVVATTVEIVLLGVAFDRDGDGDGTADGVASADDLGSRDLTLHALNYACTTDDVVVKDIASTESGRIFFAGDDEALYEVEYSGSDTWRARRCRKVCHHSAMPKLLPSILRLRAPDPLRQVLVDEYRCTLYTRSEGGAVNVFDLGPGCAETPRRVAEVRDVAAAAQMARGGGLFYGGGGGYGGHGGFNAGGSSGGAAAANRSQRGRRLVHIALVSPAESTTVTLVAVCADGRRVYFTALPAGAERMGYPGMAGAATAASSTTNPYGGYAPAPARGGGASGPNGARRLVPAPTRLAVVASREPLPQGSAQRGMTSAQALRATTTARPLEVEAAYYGDGLMLLSDAADRDEDARLFMAARDLALPSHLQVTPANVTGAGGPGGVGGYVASSGLGGGASRSLRETVTAQQLAGRAASSVGSVGEVPPPPGVMRDLAPPFPDGAPSDLALAPRRLRSELATQHVAPRRKFVIVTNAGIVQLEKARPLDALCKLLASDVHEQMAHFFRAYGQAEAATMCLAIALGCSDAAAPETSDGFDYAAAGPGATLIGAGNGGFGRDAYPGNSGAGVVHGYAATIAEKARRALEDPRLTGEPHVDDDGPDAAGASSAAFDMGRPIVQPQLHHSGVHAALYTYAARVLAATWDRPLAVTLAKRDGLDSARDWTPPRQPPRPPLADAVANGAAANGVKGAAEAAAGWLGGMLRPARGPGAPVACTLPADVLASLERRLRPLDAFLSRRRPRVVVDSHGARGVGLQPAKQRRRLEDGPAGALRAEEGSIAALRALLRRATQATALLRVVVESDFSRVASRLSEENLAELRRTTLRRLASTSEGARLASALVEALMAHRTREDRDGVEALAATLQAESPLFFGGDERAFYRARELLQAARDARDARDPVAARDRVGEALEMLLEVPLAGDPTATCAELADLRCFRGLVALPLAAAAAAADRAASRDDTLGAMTHDASIARDRTASDASFGVGSLVGGAPTPEECHEYVCVAIRALAAGTADPGAPPGSLGAVCASLDPDERAAGLTVMLERVAQASSPAAAAAARAAANAAVANAAAARDAAERAAEAAAAVGSNPDAASSSPSHLHRHPPRVSPSVAAVAAATPAEVSGAGHGDGSFLRRVFTELVALGRDAELLSLPAAPLESFLADRGAFAVAQQGGALTQDQARHLELLARLYAARGRDGLAAQVFYALAERRAADAAVSLEERSALLESALARAKRRGDGRNGGGDGDGPSPGGTSRDEGGDPGAFADAAFVETLEGKIRVLGFQRRLRASFAERARAGGADADDASRAAAALDAELKPLSDMYNDFARPAEMWGLCLEMLHFSRYQDPDGAVARQLWDRLVESAAADAPTRTRATTDACAAVRALGPELFPSDVAFPVSHVALRLELLAAGMWGSASAATVPVALDADAAPAETVADAVLAATRDSPEAAHAAYDRLLATPASRAHLDGRLAQEQQLQTPALRLRLLRSALRVLRRWEERLRGDAARFAGGGTPTPAASGFGGYGASPAHVRAALGDVCVGYAGEARRLLQVPSSAQNVAEALAADFDALGKRLVG